ncbi:MAG: hypothetical protein JSR69_00410 [Proteobacteria bacterium]|nr:hypothetical protein [Pseudomonadota bacterium]
MRHRECPDDGLAVRHLPALLMGRQIVSQVFAVQPVLNKRVFVYWFLFAAMRFFLKGGQ